VVDIVDRATRSRMMAGIGPRNTKPERIVRSYLHRQGFRFALHGRQLPGRPDIVLPRFNAVIMVHGCFWHRHHGCRFATTPSSNKAFWTAKFAENVARDRRNIRDLRGAGWRTFVLWECALSPRNLEQLARRLREVEP
jgi:DNA mismatch endonuclease (patch repair protein)